MKIPAIYKVHSLMIKQDSNDIEFDRVDRDHIKFLTQNMFLLPPPNLTGIKHHKDIRVLEFCRSFMQDYDIICFQETFTTLNTRKQMLIEIGEASGFSYHARCQPPSLFTGKLTDSGLLILSRFPIVESEFQSYGIGVFSDGISNKGVLFARIKVKDQYLNVFNTHLNASYVSTNLQELKSSLDVREQQLEQLRDFINVKIDQFGEKDLYILCGDLNVDSNPEAI